MFFTILFSVYFCGADEVGAGADMSSGQQVARSTVQAVSVICFSLCYQAVWLLITDFEVSVEDLLSCAHIITVAVHYLDDSMCTNLMHIIIRILCLRRGKCYVPVYLSVYVPSSWWTMGRAPVTDLTFDSVKELSQTLNTVYSVLKWSHAGILTVL